MSMLRRGIAARLATAGGRRAAACGARRASTLPAIVDSHQHFYDPSANTFNSFLGSLGAGPYLPTDYAAAASGVDPKVTVHIECMPDDGIAEAAWVEELVAAGECQVGAIVGNVKLPRASASVELARLVAAAPKLLRGVRFILDFDGPFDGMNATHVAFTAPGHGCVDYLRDPLVAPQFERGFALLAHHKLSFDLQCCPAQLPAAAALCGRHPSIPVVIDHMGKPRHLAADGGAADDAKLAEWRAGMALMAALPQVNVKLSMLGYAVPGWTECARREALVRQLVLETIDLFGAQRCMFASNWHGSGAMSNSDGADACDISMLELYRRFDSWVADRSPVERERLFNGTASEFYRLGDAHQL